MTPKLKRELAMAKSELLNLGGTPGNVRHMSRLRELLWEIATAPELSEESKKEFMHIAADLDEAVTLVSVCGMTAATMQYENWYIEATRSLDQALDRVTLPPTGTRS